MGLREPGRGGAPRPPRGNIDEEGELLNQMSHCDLVVKRLPTLNTLERSITNILLVLLY